MKKKKKDNYNRPDKITISRNYKMDEDQLFLQQHMMRKGSYIKPSKKVYNRKPKHRRSVFR